MLVKCVKYYNTYGEESESSSSIEKGVLYPVLAIATLFSTKEVHYYIQSSTNNDYTPHWSDARQFEIIDSTVYSGWIVDVNNSSKIQSIEVFPKEWKENELWFIDELIDETPRAVELFLQERDKICEEMGYYK